MTVENLPDVNHNGRRSYEHNTIITEKEHKQIQDNRLNINKIPLGISEDAMERIIGEENLTDTPA